jgi:hypothetical protein
MQIKQTDPEITKAVVSVLAIVGGQGTILTYDDLEAAIGLDRNSQRFKYIVAKARRRMLREMRLVTWPEYGVGFRICTNEESTTEIPAKRQHKMYRQARRAICEVQTVDPMKLPLHLRRLQAAQIDHLNAECKSLQDSRTDIFKTTETIPRRKAV